MAKVVAVHESPLGFRHGPKTIVVQLAAGAVFVQRSIHAPLRSRSIARVAREGRAGAVLAISAQPGDSAAPASR